jgi:hypothetical protein
MNKLRFTIFLCGIIAVLALLRPVQSQSDFVIENADGRRDVGMALAPALPDNLAGVVQRIVLVYVNTRRDIEMAPLPVAMQGAVNQVVERILLQYVNAKRDMVVAGPPAAMNAGLQNLVPRFVIQYANARRDMVMGYPRDLIGDTTAPQITNITTLIDSSGVRVRWTTNEFTQGTVAYGAQAGAYTANASETYFERQHELLLPPVAPGAQLHFQIVAVDLSGNQAATGDQMVAGQSHVYLPLVRRR